MFIGAGSVVFTKNLLTDIFEFPELHGAFISLHDIDPERLQTVRAVLEERREHLYHAAMLDRHAPSVLSLSQLHHLVDELIEAHGDALPEGIRPSEARLDR